MPPTIELDDFELSADEATTELNVGLITGSTAFTVASDASTSFNNSIDLGANAIDNVGNIDVNEGNAIRDNGGTNRFDIQADFTELKDETGQKAFGADNGSFNQIFAYSSTPFRIFDQNGVFTAVKYDTDASAGVLRTPKAGMRIGAEGVPSSGSGVEVNYRPSLNEGRLSAYDRSNSVQKTLALYGSPVSVRNGSLRLATGQNIQDGNGVNVLGIRDSHSHLTHKQAGGTSKSIVYDGTGVFPAVKYRTASSAPGTLELTNADLDANNNNILNAQLVNHNGTDGFSNPSAGNAKLYTKNTNSGVGGDGDYVIAANDSAGSGTKESVIFDYSAGSVSSERFKKNINTLEEDPHELLAVKPITYTSDDAAEKRAHGFLAEDLYEAWGEKAVHTKVAKKDDDWIDEEYLDKHGFEWGDEVPHQPRDRAIITAHHAVIREQQEQIESLENRIEKLEQKVAS